MADSTQQSSSFFEDTQGEKTNTDNYISFSPNTSQSHFRQNNRPPYFNNYRNQNPRQNSPYNRNQNNFFHPRGFSSPVVNQFKRGGGGYHGNNKRGKQHYGFGYQNKQFDVCQFDVCHY